MYEESELIALGHSTFVQNYKEPVPKGEKKEKRVKNEKEENRREQN